MGSSNERAAAAVGARARRRAGLLLVAALLATGAAQAATAPVPPQPQTPAAVVGSWRSWRAAGRDLEVGLELRILADGTAELASAVGGGAAFIEKGTWRNEGSTVKVVVFEPDRPPSPNEMILELRGDVLVPLRWNAEFYGTSPLGEFLKQLEGEPTR